MRKNVLLTLFLVTALGVGLSQKWVSRPSDRNGIAIENVRQLVLVMDSQNGKISKAEWTEFMAAEFDRLDTEKKGVLDQAEIRQSLYTKQARSSDLGR